MPDKATTPVFDKCNSCAFASEKGRPPVNYGPWPTSHTDVCCLYKFDRLQQSALCHLKHGQKTCDGLCKDCPSRLKLRQLQVEPQRSTDVVVASPQEGIASVHDTVRRGGSKIAPRKRRGFTKLTIEIRPPRFKKKLWFGTWQDEEIDRAKDAINYYMGSNEPFILPDSQFIFAQHPLGIEYRELKPSCEEFIRVGQKQVRASVYFARRVKEVIKAITRGTGKKKKKNAQSKYSKRASETVTHQKIGVQSSSPGSPSSTIPCPSGLTSTSDSSTMPCGSGSQFSSAADDHMVWYGASSEANSELAVPMLPQGPSFDDLVPSSDHMLPYYEGDIPIESELFSLCNWGEEVVSLEEITPFSSSSALAVPLGEGEGQNAMLLEEYNNFTAFLYGPE